MAMNDYAQPRMTRDIDFVVELGRNDAGRVARLFSEDYYVSQDAIDAAVSRESMFNLIHNESVIKVDFIVRKSSEYRAMEFSRRERVKIADFQTFLVSIEDLVLSKLVWAKDSRSEFQLRDVRNLLAVDCDEEYLGRWATNLDVASLLEECRS